MHHYTLLHMAERGLTGPRAHGGPWGPTASGADGRVSTRGPLGPTILWGTAHDRGRRPGHGFHIVSVTFGGGRLAFGPFHTAVNQPEQRTLRTGQRTGCRVVRQLKCKNE